MGKVGLELLKSQIRNRAMTKQPQAGGTARCTRGGESRESAAARAFRRASARPERARGDGEERCIIDAPSPLGEAQLACTS